MPRGSGGPETRGLQAPDAEPDGSELDSTDVLDLEREHSTTQ
jgi:hypothetical protein